MEQITVKTTIGVSIEKVWQYWTEPEHIKKWFHASDDWHAPSATNDLNVGGTFSTRMESVDGSEGFDFNGTYTHIVPYGKIEYTIEGGRRVEIEFINTDNQCTIIETFDPENENTPEAQQQGWQAILDNFKKYVDNN